MPIRYENPREIGADRLVNAVAAYDKIGDACVVVDFGTAITFDPVSAEGEYLGGVIAPGVEISMEALTERAAALPKIDLVAPRSVIGKTTVDAIRSGVVYGFAGQVDGIVRRLRAELGAETATIATGGLAAAIVPYTDEIDEVDDLLTLTGLRLLHERKLRPPEEVLQQHVVGLADDRDRWPRPERSRARRRSAGEHVADRLEDRRVAAGDHELREGAGRERLQRRLGLPRRALCHHVRGAARSQPGMSSGVACAEPTPVRNSCTKSRGSKLGAPAVQLLAGGDRRVDLRIARRDPQRARLGDRQRPNGFGRSAAAYSAITAP